MHDKTTYKKMIKGLLNGFSCRIVWSLHAGCCETFGKRGKTRAVFNTGECFFTLSESQVTSQVQGSPTILHRNPFSNGFKKITIAKQRRIHSCRVRSFEFVYLDISHHETLPGLFDCIVFSLGFLLLIWMRLFIKLFTVARHFSGFWIPESRARMMMQSTAVHVSLGLL